VPKAVPFALAQRAEKLHAQGIPFRVGLETGASMGDSCDGALARAHAVEFRTPYQSNKSMREEINAEGTHYFDMHLSHMAQDLRYGFLPKPKWAVIEASYVGEDGVIVPAAGVGIMPTICNMADKIIIDYGLRTRIMKALGVTYPTVRAALNGSDDTDVRRRIRRYALQNGGYEVRRKG
jgi:acyl-CoA hydrolase